MTSKKFKAIILDLEGVLVEWQNPPEGVSVRLNDVAREYPNIWDKLNSGKISFPEMYEYLSKDLYEKESDIKSYFDLKFQSVAVNETLVDLVHELHKSCPHLKLYIMANVCKEHFDIMAKANIPWSLFSNVFISGDLGMKKPDLCFFQHVIKAIEVNPSQIMMVDHRVENVCAARSLGIYGVLLDKTSADIYQALWDLTIDPLPAAERFMKPKERVFGEADPNHHLSISAKFGTILGENFSQLMIWELLGESRISRTVPPQFWDGTTTSDGFWTYFTCNEPDHMCPDFYNNADITSIAYLSLPRASRMEELPNAHEALDLMAKNVDSNGIMQTYINGEISRTDPETCCNILRLFYEKERHLDPLMRKTRDWVIRCLENRAYIQGSRGYSTPETFLYFIARLYSDYNPEFREPIREMIQQRIIERLDIPTNPLALAFRISACQLIGVNPHLYHQDLTKFVRLQRYDGGWPAGHFLRMRGGTGHVGNRGLTTALAIKIFRWEKENHQQTYDCRLSRIDDY